VRLSIRSVFGAIAYITAPVVIDNERYHHLQPVDDDSAHCLLTTIMSCISLCVCQYRQHARCAGLFWSELFTTLIILRTVALSTDRCIRTSQIGLLHSVPQCLPRYVDTQIGVKTEAEESG